MLPSKIETTQVPTALHWSYICLILHEYILLAFQVLWLHFCAIWSFKNAVDVSIFNLHVYCSSNKVLIWGAENFMFLLDSW